MTGVTVVLNNARLRFDIDEICTGKKVELAIENLLALWGENSGRFIRLVRDDVDYSELGLDIVTYNDVENYFIDTVSTDYKEIYKTNWVPMKDDCINLISLLIDHLIANGILDDGEVLSGK